MCIFLFYLLQSSHLSMKTSTYYDCTVHCKCSLQWLCCLGMCTECSKVEQFSQKINIVVTVLSFLNQ
jgi:hypothetical protein